MKPLFVGENNPYQPANPPPGVTREAFEARLRHYAFYPRPKTASGYRLMSILGLDERVYLAAFDRVDLCHPKWSLPKARIAAGRLVHERGVGDVIVACGSKVAQAFEQKFTPFTIVNGGVILVMLPHPSPLCRIWHEDGAVERARAVLTQAGVLPVQLAQLSA